MDKETRPRPHKPFLFDVNNFDEPGAVDPNAPPPPPVFTEAEMAAARAASFEEGRKAGHAEEIASRETFVATLTKTVADHFSTLFDAEAKRAAAFEAETLLVVRSIFAKLFPGLNEIHGLAEVERVIAIVLETHRQQPEIIVEVNGEFVDDIRDLADRTLRQLHNPGKATIKANDSLWRGDCRMLWNDGGAERNATALSAAIQRRLDEALAGRPLLQDNRLQDNGIGDDT